MDNKIRIVLGAAALAALGATAACDQPRFVDVPPPPPPYVEQPQYGPGYQPPQQYEPGRPDYSQTPLQPPPPNYPPPPPESYRDGAAPYGPPPPPNRRGPGLAGGPPPPREPQFFQMAPVPNPEDLTPQEREKIYGPGENIERKLKGVHKPAAPQPRHPGRHPAHPDHAAPAHAKPVHAKPLHAKPAPKKPVAKPTPHKKPAPAPVKKAKPAAKPLAHPKAKPAPAAVHHEPKPTAPAAAPAAAVVAATPAPAAPAAKPAAPAQPAVTQSKPAQLATALSSDVSNDSQLTVPPALADGTAQIVTLSLSPSLASRVREEAGKLGLATAATVVQAQAKLSGDGYDISQPVIPPPVTLKDGESAQFNWTVKAQPGATGPLSAGVSVILKGAGPAQTIPIATVQQKAAPAAAATDTAKPVGVSEKVIAVIILAIIAVIILAAIGRANANRRDADRTRRARAAATLGEYGDGSTTTTTTERRP